MPGPDVELDETWKERYESDLRAWRKRKDFEKRARDFFQGRLWKRVRLAGVAVLILILAVAVGFLYSEKQMGQRSDGIFDSFKKVANPF